MIKRLTATALTATLLTSPAPASSLETGISSKVKGDVCYVTFRDPGKETKTGTATKAEAQRYAEQAAMEKEYNQSQLKDYEELLKAATRKNDVEYFQKQVRELTQIVDYYLRKELVYQACTEGKAMSELQVAMSTEDGDPSGLSIGLIVVGVVGAAILLLKPLLPPEVAAILP